MISAQLAKIGREVERLGADGQTDALEWDEKSLTQLNGLLRELLVNLDKQTELWQWEVDAREALQARLAGSPVQEDRIKSLWWEEQLDFYAGLLDRMDRYLNYDEDAKVTFSLKALELLLLVRLLVEEGVIQSRTLKPVFRYLSRYSRTEKQEQLSFDSLKKRYSMHHDGARKKVKQLLINMIKRIDRPSPDD